MIYELAHFIKDKCGFIWDMIEWGNSAIFFIANRKAIDEIPALLSLYSGDFTFRIAKDDDAVDLESFFAAQPEEAFAFFKPHEFDSDSISKVIRNKALLTFIVSKDSQIIGYFFLRCFINGKCFRGKIVDINWRGKGIAKQIGIATTSIAETIGLRMFGTISPDNIASLESSKASNEIKFHKVLDNGYYYIEYLPKIAD